MTPQPHDPNDAEAEIRTARARYNTAIENRDADTIAALLAPDYHVVTGRSEHSHGVEEQRQRWAALFQRDPQLAFTRIPREIHINPAWGLAEELGDWHGNATRGALTVTTAGRYAAKWQRTAHGAWRVQAEVFTTLECSAPELAGLAPQPIAE